MVPLSRFILVTKGAMGQIPDRLRFFFYSDEPEFTDSEASYTTGR